MDHVSAPSFRVLKWCNYGIPLGILGVVIYGTWAYCHKFCYNQVLRQLHHNSVAIGLIVIVSTLDLILIILYVQIVIICGPGKQPYVPPFRIDDLVKQSSVNGDYTTIEAPKLYRSDPNRLPYWCAECNSIKLARTHHSRSAGFCIQRFDHYCIWLNTAIGRDNYLPFIQFVFYFFCNLSIVWISISSYIRKITYDKHHTINANIYVVLVFSIIGWLFTGILFVCSMVYSSLNRTSVEMVSRLQYRRLLRSQKKNKKKSNTEEVTAKENKNKTRALFLTYLNPDDGYRYVVKIDDDDKIFFNPWDTGSWINNLKVFFGNNPIIWFLPLNLTKFPIYTKEKLAENSYSLYDCIGAGYSEEWSPATIKLVIDKVNNGNYISKWKYGVEEKGHIIEDIQNNV